MTRKQFWCGFFGHDWEHRATLDRRTSFWTGWSMEYALCFRKCSECGAYAEAGTYRIDGSSCNENTSERKEKTA